MFVFLTGKCPYRIDHRDGDVRFVKEGICRNWTRDILGHKLRTTSADGLLPARLASPGADYFSRCFRVDYIHMAS